MELTDYLEQEGIHHDPAIKTPVDFKELFGKDVYKKYDELGKCFFEDNCQENIKAFYNYLIFSDINFHFEYLDLDQITQEVPAINSLIGNSKMVLDAGCNSGLKTVFYAINHPDSYFVGIDIADKALEKGRDRAERHGCKNVEFRVMDITKLSLENNKFDCVVADHSIHETSTWVTRYHGCQGQVQEYQTKLDGFYRIMKNGKLIVLLSPIDKYSFIPDFELDQEDTGFVPVKNIEFEYLFNNKKKCDVLFLSEKRNPESSTSRFQF